MQRGASGKWRARSLWQVMHRARGAVAGVSCPEWQFVQVECLGSE